MNRFEYQLHFVQGCIDFEELLRFALVDILKECIDFEKLLCFAVVDYFEMQDMFADFANSLYFAVVDYFEMQDMFADFANLLYFDFYEIDYFYTFAPLWIEI